MNKIQNKEDSDGYDARTVNLLRMGFQNYQAYLQSDLWHRIRLQVFRRDRQRCRVCRRGAGVVHHLSYRYSVLSGTHLSDLVSLCGTCHRTIEMHGKRKRSFREAKEVFLKMIRGGKHLKEHELVQADEKKAERDREASRALARRKDVDLQQRLADIERIERARQAEEQRTRPPGIYPQGRRRSERRKKKLNKKPKILVYRNKLDLWEEKRDNDSLTAEFRAIVK